ncbi:hypothetical protein ACJX0J_016742 [Zea mays]
MVIIVTIEYFKIITVQFLAITKHFKIINELFIVIIEQFILLLNILRIEYSIVITEYYIVWLVQKSVNVIHIFSLQHILTFFIARQITEVNMLHMHNDQDTNPD